MSKEELYAHILRLSREERAHLAEELLFSLEESDEQVAGAWARELERRSRDIISSVVDKADVTRACAEILAELKARKGATSEQQPSRLADFPNNL